MFFFLDGHDEEFASAPMYWLRCQKGLFYETMRLLRHGKLGGRVHVVISIRDLVLSSVLRSEHAPRYIGDPHIRVLAWDYSSAKFLLEHKVQSLRPEYWLGSVQPQDLGQWCGLDTITNSYGVVEDSSRYVLRHTQMVPRDVVLFGNHFSAVVQHASAEGRDALDPSELKKVVSDLAFFSAMTQLEMVANHLKSDDMPLHVSRMGLTELYTSNVELQRSFVEDLLREIARSEKLRLSPLELGVFQRDSSDRFYGSDVCSIL